MTSDSTLHPKQCTECGRLFKTTRKNVRYCTRCQGYKRTARAFTDAKTAWRHMSKDDRTHFLKWAQNEGR